MQIAYNVARSHMRMCTHTHLDNLPSFQRNFPISDLFTDCWIPSVENDSVFYRLQSRLLLPPHLAVPCKLLTCNGSRNKQSSNCSQLAAKNILGNKLTDRKNGQNFQRLLMPFVAKATGSPQTVG